MRKYFNIWRTRSEMARELKIQPGHAVVMRQRRHIPRKFDERLLEISKFYNLGLTQEKLTEWHKAVRLWSSEGRVGEAPAFPCDPPAEP